MEKQEFDKLANEHELYVTSNFNHVQELYKQGVAPVAQAYHDKIATYVMRNGNGNEYNNYSLLSYWAFSNDEKLALALENIFAKVKVIK